MERVKMPAAKRIFDVIASAAIIIIFFPIFIIIALAMMFEGIFFRSARGPIFYSEIRFSVGQPFRIYKFRIFKKAALEQAQKEEEIVQTKVLEGDKNNLTLVGRFLKQVYLDELPQIINVFKGEMSLVGPRPTNIVNLEKLRQAGCYSKFLMKAGITGYYQSYKGAKNKGTQEELDTRYIEFCRSNPGWKIVLYDIKIILISILTILRAEGI